MSRAEEVLVPAPRTRSRVGARPFGNLGRSLLGKLLLLVAVFIAVPIILYSEFRQADVEKRTLLLESVRAQGQRKASNSRPALTINRPDRDITWLS